MKTLLVPTDFSESADNALNYAIEFALKDHSKIILLHSDELDYQTFLYTLIVPANDAIKSVTHQLLRDRALKIGRTGVLEYDSILKNSSLSDAILSTAEEQHVDLIIMGTKGAHGLKKFLAGSNTASIVENAHCPVIAVPENAHYKDIRKITYATDYHESDVPAFQKLIRIVKPFSAELEIVHVSSPAVAQNSSDHEKMQQFLSKLHLLEGGEAISFKILEGENLAEKFEDYVNSGGTNLLVMNTQQRNLVEKLLNDSISKEITYHAKVPLLVFHHTKQPIVF
ncbi:MAG: universal stress protein [bacterium]|nr:universal stress protein [bacterium]